MPDAARDAVLETILRGHGLKFYLHTAVVMPDHVHVLLSPTKDKDGNTYGMIEIMSGIKGTSAHAVNRSLGRRGHVWLAESFDHVLRSAESTREKAEYICQNPVRAGLAMHEDAYPWLWREWVEGEREDG